MRTKYRLGVDAGGTFTDFVLADETGRVRLYKTPSTPADPTRAISTGLLLIAEDLGESIDHIVSNCDLCINGTTVALNALLQHKGVKVGLICTAGHEDSIEIRLGHKEDGYRYDHQYPPAVMLVPRYLRRPIRERVISTGEVRTPLARIRTSLSMRAHYRMRFTKSAMRSSTSSSRSRCGTWPQPCTQQTSVSATRAWIPLSCRSDAYGSLSH